MFRMLRRQGGKPEAEQDAEAETSGPLFASAASTGKKSVEVEASEVNARFRSVLDAANMPAGTRASMEASYSLEEKWAFIVSYHAREAATVSDVRPSTLAKAIEGAALTEELAATLAAKIGSASVAWVREFVKAGGLRNLASGLVFSTSKRRTRTTIAALDAVAAAFHNTNSRSLAKAVRRHDALINAVAGTLASRTPELRRRALQVLNDVASATSQSHALVLDSLAATFDAAGDALPYTGILSDITAGIRDRLAVRLTSDVDPERFAAAAKASPPPLTPAASSALGVDSGSAAGAAAAAAAGGAASAAGAAAAAATPPAPPASSPAPPPLIDWSLKVVAVALLTELAGGSSVLEERCETRVTLLHAGTAEVFGAMRTLASDAAAADAASRDGSATPAQLELLFFLGPDGSAALAEVAAYTQSFFAQMDEDATAAAASAGFNVTDPFAVFSALLSRAGAQGRGPELLSALHHLLVLPAGDTSAGRAAWGRALDGLHSAVMGAEADERLGYDDVGVLLGLQAEHAALAEALTEAAGKDAVSKAVGGGPKLAAPAVKDGLWVAKQKAPPKLLSAVAAATKAAAAASSRAELDRLRAAAATAAEARAEADALHAELKRLKQELATAAETASSEAVERMERELAGTRAEVDALRSELAAARDQLAVLQASERGAPSSSVLPKKPNNKPESGVAMRGFFWSKLPDRLAAESKWKDLPDTGINVNTKEIEAMFASKSKASGSGGGAKEASAAKKTGSILLFDPKRQQNAGIALARLRMPTSEIVTKLMDIESLSFDQVRMLESLQPSAEEIEMVTSFDGETERLGALEQFVLGIKDVPNIQQRLESAAFRLKFGEMVSELKRQLSTVDAAMDIVDGCQELQSLLRFTLAIGNYLNTGTKRGGAYGFKLDSLGKLRDVRTSDGKSNLLEYMARVAVDSKAGMRAWGIFRVPERMEGVALAKDTSLNEVSNELRKLQSKFNAIKAAVAAAHDDDDAASAGDRFAEVMGAFIEKEQATIEQLVEAGAKTRKRFDEVLAAFAEDPGKDSIAFFTQWATFSSDFGRALAKATKALEDAAKASGAAKGGASKAGAAATGKPGTKGGAAGPKATAHAPVPSAMSISKKLADELNARRRRRQAEDEQEDEDESARSPTAGPTGAAEASGSRSRRRSVLQSDRWRRGRKSIAPRGVLPSMTLISEGDGSG